MSVFGGVSKGERNRIKIRVRTAMAVQAQLEGRFLGGRLPYGYKLIDAGPHPNPAKAVGGKRLHALAIDELPAEVVGRIFGLFIAGHGIYAIEVLIDVQDVTLGHMAKVRWNDEDQWIFSDATVHPPIIDAETFRKAQDLLTARKGERGGHKPHRSRHTYTLRGCYSAESAIGACKVTGPTPHRITDAASPASTPSLTTSATR